MGAMVFFILMIIMLGTGVLLLITGFFLFLVYRKRKSTSKHPKLCRNISVCLFCIGLLVCVVPVGWLIFIRSVNGSVAEDFIDTGIWVQWENGESFTYKKEKYVEMEYKPEVFYYDANYDAIAALQEEYEAEFNTYRSGFWNVFFNDEEADMMYKLNSGTGETLYYNGSFYCREEAMDEVEKYYADDANYEWYFVTYDETTDLERKYPIEVTVKERTYLYNIDNLKKEKAIFTDDTLQYGNLVKISKDGLFRASLFLVEYEDEWYWDTEIIDESKEKDGWWPTYIQKLPTTLLEKMNHLEE